MLLGERRGGGNKYFSLPLPPLIHPGSGRQICEYVPNAGFEICMLEVERGREEGREIGEHKNAFDMKESFMQNDERWGN